MSSEVRDELKDWKLIQGILGTVTVVLVLFGVQSGHIAVRDWIPLPATPTPDTTAFHLDAMRRAYHDDDLVTALDEAEIVRMREPKRVEVRRVRAVCLLRLRRFDEQQYLLLNRGFNWVQERPFNR